MGDISSVYARKVSQPTIRGLQPFCSIADGFLFSNFYKRPVDEEILACPGLETCATHTHLILVSFTSKHRDNTTPLFFFLSHRFTLKTYLKRQLNMNRNEGGNAFVKPAVMRMAEFCSPLPPPLSLKKKKICFCLRLFYMIFWKPLHR